MSTENPHQEPPLPKEYAHPPPYSAANYPQQQQVLLVVIPVHGGALQTVNSNVTYFDSSGGFGQAGSNSFCPATTQRIFSDISKRQVFVRKVYAIVSAQLVTVAIFMSVFLFHPTLWTHVEPGINFLFAVFFTVIPIFVYGCCACYCSMPKSSPGNVFCLVLHTIALAFIFAIISAIARTEILLLSVVISTLVCVSLTIFATNFATCGGFLFVVGITAVIFSFLILFLRNWFPVLYLIYACVGALIFSTFLVYDIQLMVMGKHRQSASISWNDYVFAVHTFHMDMMVVWFCRCPRKCCCSF